MNLKSKLKKSRSTSLQYRILKSDVQGSRRRFSRWNLPKMNWNILEESKLYQKHELYWKSFEGNEFLNFWHNTSKSCTPPKNFRLTTLQKKIQDFNVFRLNLHFPQISYKNVKLNKLVIFIQRVRIYFDTGHYQN
jgi:hypothetical protein